MQAPLTGAPRLFGINCEGVVKNDNGNVTWFWQPHVGGESFTHVRFAGRVFRGI